MKVTAEEEARLVLLAEEQGVSVPRLLVESAFSAGVETSSERRNLIAELFSVHRLLAQVSNNVNQLAKQANATSEVPAETAAALGAVRRVAGRIDETVEALGR